MADGLTSPAAPQGCSAGRRPGDLSPNYQPVPVLTATSRKKAPCTHLKAPINVQLLCLMSKSRPSPIPLSLWDFPGRRWISWVHLLTSVTALQDPVVVH